MKRKGSRRAVEVLRVYREREVEAVKVGERKDICIERKLHL